jgi:hypothetical protein
VLLFHAQLGGVLAEKSIIARSVAAADSKAAPAAAAAAGAGAAAEPKFDLIEFKSLLLSLVDGAAGSPTATDAR